MGRESEVINVEFTTRVSVRASVATPQHTFASKVIPAAATRLDRWALGRIQESVASAPLRFALWDGFELPSSAGPPIATIVFKNRRALSSWVWDSELNFGETYVFGAVEVHGDLLATLEATSVPGHQPPRLVVVAGMHDVQAAKENVHRHYNLT